MAHDGHISSYFFWFPVILFHLLEFANNIPSIVRQRAALHATLAARCGIFTAATVQTHRSPKPTPRPIRKPKKPKHKQQTAPLNADPVRPTPRGGVYFERYPDG